MERSKLKTAISDQSEVAVLHEISVEEDNFICQHIL